MKRIVTLILPLVMGLLTSVQASAGVKKCPACQGSGHVYGHTELICPTCKGAKMVPLTAAEERNEARDRANYNKSSGDLMELYNLTSEEVLLFQDLLKQAYTNIEVYEKCTVCNGSTKCILCGGRMAIGLDDPICIACGGSGLCITCKGLGEIFVGYQENPDKEIIIEKAYKILHKGERRKHNHK